ncbi:ABC transporter permease [Ornithinibacillus halophilus]|uniref:Carbohydrate ABC transporter membrane protein 1, CUT1 family n=1 Tax=Ornithinibacillus halophilus TaxID=930117 RepID=A0A1M5K383_9BACI|nr:ABC transporter permease subunit [Ornithinibacillus halophilus]SHG47050.1 carbohydrate ABC transporter membrane protein 1, CUT1 family [Ornithinibacillus halophilus]
MAEQTISSNLPNNKPKKKRFNWRKLKINWQLYLLLAPGLIYFLLFKYYPMYGLQIAFKDFRAVDGILGSEWIGFDHFIRFFNSYYFWDLIKNTLGINLYALALFPISIVVALALNELRDGKFKKTAQTITYAPHFISVVVFVGMIIAFLNPVTGIINNFIQWIGFEPISFMTEPGWFKSIFVWSNEWQNLGWGAIIYLAALAGVDPQLHEAAKVDGASRLQRIWHINLPSILPTIIILLILNMGNMMSIGFEKILLMQNELNLESSQVIQTYVYEAGLLHGQYSYSTAVGLFNSIINFGILIFFNRLARRTGTSLW